VALPPRVRLTCICRPAAGSMVTLAGDRDSPARLRASLTSAFFHPKPQLPHMRIDIRSSFIFSYDIPAIASSQGCFFGLSQMQLS